VAAARACLEGALAADARHAPAALALAHLLRHTGAPADLALAAAHAESALRARPDYVSAWCVAAPRRSSCSPRAGMGGRFVGMPRTVFDCVFACRFCISVALLLLARLCREECAVHARPACGCKGKDFCAVACTAAHDQAHFSSHGLCGSLRKCPGRRTPAHVISLVTECVLSRA